MSHSNLSWLWPRILANWATAVIFLLLSPVVAYLISQVFGVRATQFLLRLRSSTLFEWMLLFVTFALGTVFLVLHELRVSSGVPYFLKWVASWLGEADAGVGWQQLVFPLCLALRMVHLLVDFFRPDIHAVLVWLGLLRHDVADSLEQHSPRSRLWWILALDIVLLSGNAVALLLVFPWSDSALREEFQLPWLEWLVELLLTLTVRLLLSFLLWWFVPVVMWSPLHRQAPCDGANGVTHVDVCNLRAGGWDANNLRIYVRPQAAEQYTFLDSVLRSLHDRVAHIEGPPGTGKSTLTWAWACEQAQQQPVLWVHQDSGGGSLVALLGGGRVSWWTMDIHDQQRVYAVSQWAGVRILVVDGVTAERRETFSSVGKWANGIGEWARDADVPRRRAVFVSSTQFNINDSDRIRYHVPRSFFVFSWKKEEYMAACGDPQCWEICREFLGWVAPGAGEQRDEVAYIRAVADSTVDHVDRVNNLFRACPRRTGWQWQQHTLSSMFQ